MVGKALLEVQSKNATFSALGGGPFTNANEQPTVPLPSATAKATFQA
ncbi:MAG TPA: hypothetical protein VIK30_10985 [Polyangia bacterium]